MPPREVEIKFIIEDPRAVEHQLRQLGFAVKTRRTHEMNTLFDQPGAPLRRRGELLRLRKYGRDWTLTHKGKGVAGRHKTRQETETRVANGEKMSAILRSLGFFPSFRYEKFRSEWSDGK